MVLSKTSISFAIEDAIDLAKKSGKVAKNGKTYIELVVIEWDKPLEGSKNNCSVVLPKTKEQIEAKEKDVTIGNGRTFYKAQQAQATPPQVAAQQAPPANGNSKWSIS